MDMYRILENFDAVNSKQTLTEGSMKRHLHALADKMSKEDFVADAAEYGMTPEEATEFWNNVRGADDEELNEDLQADSGQYYEDSADFFGMFEQDHFDHEEESEDGMEVHGYIDGKLVMAWRFNGPDMTDGYGAYDDSELIDEERRSQEDFDDDAMAKQRARLAREKQKIMMQRKISGQDSGKPPVVKDKDIAESDMEEGNKFAHNVLKAKAAGIKKADLDDDGDVETVREVFPGTPEYELRFGKDDASSAFDKKKISTGTVYSRKHFDEPDTDDDAPRAAGRPKGTGRKLGAKGPSVASKLLKGKGGLKEHDHEHGMDMHMHNDLDSGEYDQEGDMAQQDLHTVVDAARELHSILASDENLPEWVQAKITKALDYIDTARDYVKSSHAERGEEVAEASPMGGFKRGDRVTVDGQKGPTGSTTGVFVQQLPTQKGQASYYAFRFDDKKYPGDTYDVSHGNQIFPAGVSEAKLQPTPELMKKIRAQLEQLHDKMEPEEAYELMADKLNITTRKLDQLLQDKRFFEADSGVSEVGYSAKAGRAGKDLGKPGKNFSKIAAGAAERYGSKAAGERVAGAVLNKLRHPTAEGAGDLRSSVLSVIQHIYDGAAAGEEMVDDVASELGQYFSQVKRSNDQALRKAYQLMRREGAEAEGDPEYMAQVAQQAIDLLSQPAVKEESADKKDLPFTPDTKSSFKKSNNPNRTNRDSVKALAQKGLADMTTADLKAELKRRSQVEEESTDTKDQHAEKAGKKVTKDIEHDEGHKGRDDAKAEKAGKKVAKDIEYDDKKDKEEKVDETTVSGSVAPAAGGNAPKKGKGGMQFGQGVYEGQVAESFEKKLKNVLNEGMSVNVSTDDTGKKSISVNATDSDADALGDMLKMAGLFSSEGYSSVCQGCGGIHEAGACGADMVEEDLANSPDEVYTDADYMTQTLSGGLNGPKTTGQTTIPVINRQDSRQGVMAEAERVKEQAESRLWNLYKKI